MKKFGVWFRPGAYAFMLSATVGAILWIQSWGSRINPRQGAAILSGGPHADRLAQFLLALVVITCASWIGGRLFRSLGQTSVVGEIIAGIALGPSLLGALAPNVSTFLLPPRIMPPLEVMAQLGIMLYMFQVGLELDFEKLKETGHTAVVISHASIALPFVAGTALSLWLYPSLCRSEVPFSSFSLFLGVAMSVTAFPVLARILADFRMQETSLGRISLCCAAVDDATAWCLLALVSISQAKVGSALWAFAGTAAFVALMVTAVRSRLSKFLASRTQSLGQGTMTFIIVAVLLCAFSTELIGIHTVFGVFLLGLVLPNESSLAREIKGKMTNLVNVLLLPAFFVLTGMKTSLALLSGWKQWLICGVIILVATVSKAGGAFLSARLHGMSWRESAGIGALMNTRGLVELIVLNIGLELNIISPVVFAMLVIMAVVTTLLTAPALRLLRFTHNEQRLRTSRLEPDPIGLRPVLE